MTSRTTRRMLVRACGGAGVLLTMARRGRVTAQQDAQSGGLGLTRDEFETIVGAGTEVDGFVRYDDPVFRNAVIHVLYEEQRSGDDRATFMEIDLSETWSDGVLQDAALDHGLSFAPFSSEPLARYVLGLVATQTDEFDVRVGENIELAAGAGPGYIVSLEAPTPGDGAEAPSTQRIALATEEFRTLDVSPSGEPGGLGRPYDEWIDQYGVLPASQAGPTFPVPEFDGGVLVGGVRAGTVDRIQGTSEAGMSLDTVLAAIGGWLPADAERERTFFLRPTPGGPIGVRIQTWNLPSLETRAAALLYVEGEGETETVSRVTMALESTDDEP